MTAVAFKELDMLNKATTCMTSRDNAILKRAASPPFSKGVLAARVDGPQDLYFMIDTPIGTYTRTYGSKFEVGKKVRKLFSYILFAARYIRTEK